MLTVLHDKVFSFNGSLLGFNRLDRFHFSVMEENPVYAYLQSEEDEHIGFLVINPFVFFPDYNLELDETTKDVLELQSHEEAAIVGIVTIQKPFSNSTVNLLAPLILNVTNGSGRQVVLPPKSDYSTKEPLFKNPTEGGGE
ncbi:flagellar assembly protein FliW [Paenibacillus sp. P25]|nr:flagellar assembly protein FliW [Paenibacillus sp. P25]